MNKVMLRPKSVQNTLGLFIIIERVEKLKYKLVEI